MTYLETQQWLYKQLPVFHRIGAAAYKIDISNTVDLLSSIGNPHHCFNSIHVAGTNGKGSSSHLHCDKLPGRKAHSLLLRLQVS